MLRCSGGAFLSEPTAKMIPVLLLGRNQIFILSKMRWLVSLTMASDPVSVGKPVHTCQYASLSTLIVSRGFGFLPYSPPLRTSPRGVTQKLEFQAETRQLLDIVTHSIYTDKEVFLRELISNASDAMEKLRHLQVVGEAVEEGAAPLEITITTDEKEKTITIQDTVRDEMGLWS